MTASPSPLRYRFGRCELQPDERRLLATGAPVAVGPRAFDLLVVLVERGGHLVTKDELLERVWPKVIVEENTLQAQIGGVLAAAAIEPRVYTDLGQPGISAMGISDSVAAGAPLMKVLVGMADSAFVRVLMGMERVEMSVALFDATESP